MTLYSGICLLLAALPAVAQQSPSITKIQNNYSYTTAGSPNYGIAQGSLFIIAGSGLAPSTLSASLASGLPSTLNGVSVSVAMNGTTQSAYLYYTYAANGLTQIGAVLPSSVPVGNGTLTVRNGSSSVSAPITVVATAVGFDTLSGVGTGRAIAQDGAGNLLTSTNAANPGQTVVIWGTAAGPDPNNDDHTYPQKQNNLSNPSLEIDIGGIPATVVYRGRSQYPGVDQFNLTIPANVSTGCYVSLVAFNGADISNFASLPIAATGKTCTDPVPGFGLSVFATPNTPAPGSGNGPLPVNIVYGEELQALAATSPINLANIVYETDNQPPTANLFGIPLPAQSFSAQATFLKYNPGALYEMLSPYMISEGSCTVFPVFESSITSPLSPLDAGSNVTITGPGGSSTLSGSLGSYQQGLASSLFGSAPGSITMSDGSGGADIGAFTTAFTYPQPALVWNEQNTLQTVDRSQPLTLTWSGGVPGTAVVIYGVSDADLVPQGGTKAFLCLAPVGAKTFTVPETVLASLPNTASLDGLNSTAYIAVSNSTNPAVFSASGISNGYISGLIFDNVGITSDTFTFQ